MLAFCCEKQMVGKWVPKCGDFCSTDSLGKLCLDPAFSLPEMTKPMNAADLQNSQRVVCAWH